MDFFWFCCFNVTLSSNNSMGTIKKRYLVSTEHSDKSSVITKYIKLGNSELKGSENNIEIKPISDNHKILPYSDILPASNQISPENIVSNHYKQHFGVKPCKNCILILKDVNDFSKADFTDQYNYCKLLIRELSFCSSCKIIYGKLFSEKAPQFHHEKMGSICHYKCFLLDFMSFIYMYRKIHGKMDKIRKFIAYFDSIDNYRVAIRNLNVCLKRKYPNYVNADYKNMMSFFSIYRYEKLYEIIDIDGYVEKIEALLVKLRQPKENLSEYLTNIQYTILTPTKKDFILYKKQFIEKFINVKDFAMCLFDLKFLDIIIQINSIYIENPIYLNKIYTAFIFDLIVIKYLTIILNIEVPENFETECLKNLKTIEILTILIYKNDRNSLNMLNQLLTEVDTLKLSVKNGLIISNILDRGIINYISISKFRVLILSNLDLLFLFNLFLTLNDSEIYIENIHIYQTTYLQSINKLVDKLKPFKSIKTRRPSKLFELTINNSIRCFDLLSLLYIFSSFAVKDIFVINITNSTADGANIYHVNLLEPLFAQLGIIQRFCLHLDKNLDLENFGKCIRRLLLNLVLNTATFEIQANNLPKLFYQECETIKNLVSLKLLWMNIVWQNLTNLLKICPGLEQIEFCSCDFDFIYKQRYNTHLKYYSVIIDDITYEDFTKIVYMLKIKKLIIISISTPIDRREIIYNNGVERLNISHIIVEWNTDKENMANLMNFLHHSIDSGVIEIRKYN